jgi:rieske iron-sulfur protein
MRLPQPGDSLVSAGNNAGTTPLRPGDLVRQHLVLARWLDAGRKVPSDRSRPNMVLSMRFDPTTLGTAEKKLAAADGVVAFSAVCTHQQRRVTSWLKTTQVLQWPCSQSQHHLRHWSESCRGRATDVTEARGRGLRHAQHTSAVRQVQREFSQVAMMS